MPTLRWTGSILLGCAVALWIGETGDRVFAALVGIVAGGTAYLLPGGRL